MRSSPPARIGDVPLSRIAWLTVVIACAIAVVILVLSHYRGYAGVVLVVGLSAAINLR
jgi:hypothetical protein